MITLRQISAQSIHLNVNFHFTDKYPIEDIVYLWANSPPTVLPVEVSQELLNGFYEFKEAVAEDCAGNYTIGWLF